MQAARIPPNDVEAEAAVLGALMVDADVAFDVMEAIRPEDFYLADHQAIYAAIRDLYGRGAPIDVVAVAREMVRRGYDRVNDSDIRLYLRDLSNEVALPSTAGYHARALANLAALRRILDATAKAQELIYAGTDPETAVDRTEALVYDAAHGNAPRTTVHIRDVVRDLMAGLDAPSPGAIPTGFPDLDRRLLGGLYRGALVLVAARPGIGKTAFVSTVARSVAIRDPRARVVFFTVEMSASEIAERLLSAEANVPFEALRRQRPQAGERPRLERAAGTLSEAPIHLVDAGALSLPDIRARARRLAAVGGLGLVVVDYLQLMASGRRSENRQQEIADISRGLKVLAREIDVPVLAVSQLNRNPVGRADKRPELTDLRESGALEQDADVVLFLYRGEDGTANRTDVIIGKQRNGPTGSVVLSFRASHMEFSSYAEAAA